MSRVPGLRACAVAIACFALLFVNIGCVSTSFAVYQPYLAALPGVGDAGAAAVISARALVSLLVLTVADRVIARIGARATAVLACVCTGAGFIGYGVAQGMAGLLAGAAFAGLGNGLGGMVCVTLLLDRWYPRGVGAALGFASVGSGVAGVVVPTAVVAFVERASLGSAFVAEGLVALLVAVLTFFLVRNRPAALSETPCAPLPAGPGGLACPQAAACGDSAHADSACTQSVAPDEPAGSEGALCGRLPVLVACACAAAALFGAVSVGGVSYLAIYLEGTGFDPSFAASALSGGAGCLIAAKLVAGRAFDRMGAPRTTLAFSAVLLAGLLLLCTATPAAPWRAVVGTALFYAGIALGSVGISVWSVELVGPEDRARNVRRMQASCMAGGVAFNLLPGVLVGLVGSYAASYALMAGCVAIGAALVLRAYALSARTASRCGVS